MKGRMSGDARDFNNMETRAVIKFFSCKARSRRKFTPFWKKHYRNTHHRMPPSKTGWPCLNMVSFPPVMRLVLDDPKQWPPRDYWLNSRANLGRPPDLNWTSHVSRLGLSFMKIWTCGISPRSGSRNAWTRIKHVKDASRLSNIWNFFGAVQMISCRDWWPWTKPGYITITRKQSNNQWSGGIAAHPSPNRSEYKNRW